MNGSRMTFRTQNQLQGSRPMPVRWMARSWSPRITQLPSCSAPSADCRELSIPGVVCLWRRRSKPAYLVSVSAWASCSADFQSISISRNRRGPRGFCGARLCEPQDVGSDRRAGFVKTLGGRQSSCGSQTRAPIVAASPRCAVSPNCIRQSLESLPRAGVSLDLAECNSAIQQSKTLRYDGALNRCKPVALRTDKGREGSDNHSFFPRFGPTTH